MMGAGLSAYADIRVKCIQRCSVTGGAPASAMVVIARAPVRVHAVGVQGSRPPCLLSPRSPLVGLLGELEIYEGLGGADAGNRPDLLVEQVEQVVVVGAHH